jgi:hypothetical protein
MAKKTMTDEEMNVLEQLSQRKEMSKTALLRQALRLYQMVDARLADGQKLFFERDLTKEKAELMVI